MLFLYQDHPKILYCVIYSNYLPLKDPNQLFKNYQCQSESCFLKCKVILFELLFPLTTKQSSVVPQSGLAPSESRELQWKTQSAQRTEIGS